MKTFSSYLLILFLVGISIDANAILTPKISPDSQNLLEKRPKPKLKEKVALWVLRRKIKKQLRKHRNRTNAIDTTSCDQILLKTGDRLDVKIVKISDESVRFVRCNEDDSAELVLSKDDIHEIKLSDGILVYKNLNKSRKKSQSGGSDAGRIVLIVLAVLGGILLLWLSILLALLSSL